MAKRKKLKKRLSGNDGRQGRKNIIKTDTGYLLQGGFEITEKERKEFNSLINKAKYKRNKMLKEFGQLELLENGEPTGHTASSRFNMGAESDFILQRKSGSLQHFKSREDFEHYIDRLKYVNSENYISDRVDLYKENYKKAILNEFGNEGQDIIDHIDSLKDKDAYMRLVVQSDEDLEISYVYSNEERTARLNRIRHALGLPLDESESIEDVKPRRKRGR